MFIYVRSTLMYVLKYFLSFYLYFLSFNLLSFAQNLDRVQVTIADLCSPEMQGRGYVNRGDSIAAEYLSQQFQEIGLQPFGEDYYQYFTLSINTFPEKVALKIDKNKRIVGQDFIVNPVSGSGKGSAKVVFLDSLTMVKDSLRTVFLNQDLSKSVVVYQDYHYATLSEHALDLLPKLKTAKAIIELESQKLTGTLAYRPATPPYFQIFADLFPKDAKKIKFKLDATHIPNYRSQNLIGYLPGSQYPEQYLVISAHYDHLGKMGNEVYFPGANDNAAGVAMLLELARYYQKAENQLPYTLVFMLFGAEEAGLIGSKYYTDHPLFPLEDIEFLVNLDLVGTGDDGITVVNGSVFREQFDKLVDLNLENNYLPAVKIRGAAPNSDHYYFSERGVGAFFIYTLGGIQAYHDIYDIPETLPLTRFTELFQLIQDFLEGFD